LMMSKGLSASYWKSIPIFLVVIEIYLLLR
jgi:hypothetical protein